MSQVLTAVREKYPAYKDTPDEELIRALGAKYPVYLESDPEFKVEYDIATRTRTLSTFLEQAPAELTETSPVTPDARIAGPAGDLSQPFDIQQEPAEPIVIGETPAEIPRFGEPETFARGVSDVISGTGEFVVNKPEEFLASIYPPTAIAVLVRYAPQIVRDFAIDAYKAVTGDQEALGRAGAMAAMVGLPFGAREALKARQRVREQAKEPVRPVEPAIERTPDAVPQREATAVPVEEPSPTRPQVVEQVREQATPEAQKAPVAETLPETPAAERVVETTVAPVEVQAAAGAVEPAAVAAAVPEGPANTGTKLTPAPPVITATPKSQRQIIEDIAKGLDIPIRFGRLENPRAGGYFKRISNLIGSKRANDIPVVTHEAGHKLDAMFNLSSVPSILPELEVLGDPATAGSMSSWTKSKTKKYKMGEGMAEFVRYWMTDPPEAQRVAPNTFAHFETILNTQKDLGDMLRTAQKDIQVWRNSQPQARLRSHISVGENPTRTPYTLSQLTRDLVDDLQFSKLATDAVKKSEPNLPPSKDIYLQARLLRGTYGMAESFIRKGVADFKSKAVTLGTSLEDALKPVAGRLDDFRDWIVAKRAQELRGRGKETGLVASDVDFVASKFDPDPQFQQAFTKVKEWQDSLLQYAEDAGLLTAESRKAMQELNRDYVPYHRVFEVGAGEAPAIEAGGSGRGLNVGQPGSIKRLTGSLRDIVDPMESMLKNAYAIITASEKAHIHKALAEYADKPDMGRWVERIATPKEQIKVGVEKIREQLETAGADLSKVPDDLLLSFYQNSGVAPVGENVIRIVRDGKPEFYRLDSDLFKTFNALDLEDAGQILNILGKPAQLLRSGVVLAPDFALANALRDTFSAAVISKYGAYPFEVTLKGFGAMIKNPKLVAEWAASGGKNSIEAAFFDRKKAQEFLREKIVKDLTPSERATVILKSPLTALRFLTEKFEEATRIGEYMSAYDKLRKSGMPEGESRRLAAFESRDRQDFSKGGAKIKWLRRITPFWNAAVQGNLKLAQALKERPVRTILQGMAFVTLPKLLEQAINYNDPDYWDRPQWERDLFFLIPFAKDDNGRTRFFRIPTPFEVGVIFGTLPGRVIQYAHDTGDESVPSYLATLLHQTVPNPIPPFANVIFENFLSGKQGWSIFRQRPVVPDSLADAPPDLQWTEQTSLSARKLGKLLGYSPLKIDHIISSTTGGMGKLLTFNVSDPLVSMVTGEQATAQGKGPGGRFVSTPAGVSSQAVEDFYERYAKIAGEDVRLRSTGEAAEFAGLINPFRRAAQQMSRMRRQSRQTTDPKERQLLLLEIRRLAEDMNKLARESGL